MDRPFPVSVSEFSDARGRSGETEGSFRVVPLLWGSSHGALFIKLVNVRLLFQNLEMFCCLSVVAFLWNTFLEDKLFSCL